MRDLCGAHERNVGAAECHAFRQSRWFAARVNQPHLANGIAALQELHHKGQVLVQTAAPDVGCRINPD